MAGRSFQRIVNDIPADAIERVCVTNDMCGILMLPKHNIGVSSNALIRFYWRQPISLKVCRASVGAIRDW